MRRGRLKPISRCVRVALVTLSALTAGLSLAASPALAAGPISSPKWWKSRPGNSPFRGAWLLVRPAKCS